MHKLTIVIVSYNVKHYLAQCLHSIERASHGIDVEVVVVDNHSKDDTVAYIAKHFPKVQLIACHHNNGFAAANNLAIRQTQSEYVLLLNPDTLLSEQTLTQTLQFMDQHPQAGGLGVCMQQATGEKAPESRRGIPTPMTAFYKMSGLCKHFPRHRRFSKYYMSYLPWDEPNQIEIISGAFCLLRRKALEEVGLLDEQFFMYGEDIDLSYRLLKNGWENWYYPALILHYKGESTNHTSFRYVHVFYKAMLIFFRKHFSNTGLLLSIPIHIAIYTQALIALLRNLFMGIRKSLGFVMHNKESILQYHYIGPDDQHEAFKTFALQHGLLTTTDQSADIINVYDASAMSYQDILLDNQQHHSKHGLGIFYPETRKLITHHEVIC